MLRDPLRKPWAPWVAVAAGLPLTAWLAWVWLGLAERDVLDLTLSVVLAVLILGILSAIVSLVFAATLRRSALFVVSVLAVFFTAPLIHVSREWVLRGLILMVLSLCVPLVLLWSPQMLRTGRYWFSAFGLSMAVYVIPCLLITWVPGVPSLAGQTASMMARFAISYAVAVVGLVFFARYVRSLAGNARA
jgi:hypothetical protein